MNYWRRLWLSRAEMMTGDPAARACHAPGPGVCGSPKFSMAPHIPPPALPEADTGPALRQAGLGAGWKCGSGPNIIKIQDGDSGALSKRGALLSTGAVGLAWLHTGKLAGQVLLLRPLYQRGDCQGRGVLQGRLP